MISAAVKDKQILGIPGSENAKIKVKNVKLWNPDFVRRAIFIAVSLS
jgi:hypothetical protein